MVPGSSTDGVTDYVKFYYGDQSVDDDDVLTVTVYDINDNVLESTTVSLPGAGYVEFSYAVACIHKIHISVDDDPVDNRGFAVDNLTYNIPTAPNGCGAGGDRKYRYGLKTVDRSGTIRSIGKRSVTHLLYLRTYSPFHSLGKT